MKLKFLLVAGLCGVVLAFSLAEPALAQRSADSRSNKQEVLFPEASRESPKPKSGRQTSQLQKAFKAYDKDKFEETIEIAEAVAGHEKANTYEKAQAFYIAGVAAQQLDEEGFGRTISYFERAIAADGLENNVHYQLMQQLAQMHLSEERYEQALAFTDRFLQEVRQDKPEMLVLRGNTLYRMERYSEAIESIEKALSVVEKPDTSWTQLLMAAYLESDQPAKAAELAERLAADKPDDKRALQNLIAIYMQADQPEKAGEVLDRMRAAGQLTESRDYENAYRLLANIEGRENDAIALIMEGLDNKILSPSYEIFQFLGQVYYFSDRSSEAIAAWQKAAPLAPDGETFLNLAKVLVMEERYAEGKVAAHKALEKGVKKPGDAWMTVARAEFADAGKNREAILAAYRQAAKYPETKEQALRQIKQMSR